MDPREVLGIPPDAGEEEIRSAYVRRLLSVDPCAPFVSVIELPAGQRRFAGPHAWLKVLEAPEVSKGK